MKTFLSALIILPVLLSGCVEKRMAPPRFSPDYQKAAALYGTANDSSFYYFNRVVNNSEDSFQIATSYYYMALIQATAGDYFGSQESVLSSQKYLKNEKASDHYLIALNYNSLGSTSLNLQHYNQAVNYYNLAMKYDTSSAGRTYYLNNKALAYQKQKKFFAAVDIYQSLINTKIDSIAEYARVLSNLAKSKWLADSNYLAAPELWTALKIRQDKQDNWGLNASYSHLSDYYARTRRDSALVYARKMWQKATELDSPDDELEALQKLINLEESDKAKNFFTRYLKLNDSIQLARNTAKNQFALIRFDAEKAKADNLLLQAENAEKKASIDRQRFTLVGLTIFILTATVSAFYWYKRKQERMAIKTQHEIQQHRLRTSEKVHDVVANGLYRLMSEIQHKDIDKETVLDKIEVLYEKSRDISYESPVNIATVYHEKINDLLTSFSSEDTKVLIVGNSNDFWQSIPSGHRDELEHVLQELMINMRKHSQAKNVVVKFEAGPKDSKISYTDDGIGIGDEVKFGNGLTNTGNRIRGIGGAINFERGKEKGLRVQITFSNINNDN